MFISNLIILLFSILNIVLTIVFNYCLKREKKKRGVVVFMVLIPMSELKENKKRQKRERRTY